MALTISKSEDCSLLYLKSDLLSQMFDVVDPVPYENIKITIFRNCCDCDNVELSIRRNSPAAFPSQVLGSYDYNYATQLMELNVPATGEFGTDTWGDGVYRIVITISDDDQGNIESEQNCFFVDCETSCKVAKHLKELIAKEEDTEVHLLHFGLVNASNCNCNCEEMCYLYRKLFAILEKGTECLCCS